MSPLSDKNTHREATEMLHTPKAPPGVMPIPGLYGSPIELRQAIDNIGPRLITEVIAREVSTKIRRKKKTQNSLSDLGHYITRLAGRDRDQVIEYLEKSKNFQWLESDKTFYIPRIVRRFFKPRKVRQYYKFKWEDDEKDFRIIFIDKPKS